MGRLGCESIARLEFPQNSQTLSNYDPHSPQMPGFLEFWGNSTLPAFSHFQASGILGKFEPGSVLVTSDANSNFPKICSNFPKIPKTSATMARAPHGCQDFGILGNSSLAMFWQPRMRKHCQARISQDSQLHHVLIHELSIASVPNCALASFIEESHSCC